MDLTLEQIYGVAPIPAVSWAVEAEHAWLHRSPGSLKAAACIGCDQSEIRFRCTFGQKPAEVLAHGLSRLTPWDISGRVGLNNLIFPDIQEGLEGKRLAESTMTAALGPVAGIGVNALKGLQEMSHGRYQLGLETMAPSFLRGPLKGMRPAIPS